MKYTFAIIVVAFVLSGCGSHTDDVELETASARPAKILQSTSKKKINVTSKGRIFHTVPVAMQCVPYAREESGIPIRGDAHTWWDQADGQYGRGAQPKVGAVMVLSKTPRLSYGHVAVVKKVVSKRLIEVAHSNWGSDKASRCIVYENMPVKDVSKNNDWSEAEFLDYPSNTFGRPYAVSGFIYQN